MRRVPSIWMPWSRLTVNNGMPARAEHMTHIDRLATYLGAAYKPLITTCMLPPSYPLDSTSAADPSGTDADRVTAYIYIPPYTDLLQVWALVGGIGTIDWYSGEEAAGESPMRMRVDEAYRTSPRRATAYWAVSETIREATENANRLLDVSSVSDRRTWRSVEIDIYIQDDGGGSSCFLYEYFFVPLTVEDIE